MNLFRHGGVGFIDWLGSVSREKHRYGRGGGVGRDLGVELGRGVGLGVPVGVAVGVGVDP